MSCCSSKCQFRKLTPPTHQKCDCMQCWHASASVCACSCVCVCASVCACGGSTSCICGQSYWELMLEVMQLKEKWYWAYFCDFRGLDFPNLVMHPPLSICAFSWSNFTQSHVLHPERKLPDHFPHRQFTCKQLRMSASESLWLWVCVCVCVFILSLMFERLPEQLKRQWDIYLQGWMLHVTGVYFN